MANTSTRTLRLLSLLQTHRYWPGEELADRLGVSIRTLRRDVERLRSLGYPVRASRGVAGGYQLAPGAALPPLLLDDDEAVALAVGLRTAAQGAVAGIAEASVRALAKVVQVMPPRLRRRVDALHTMTVAPTWAPDWHSATADALVTVATACRDAERLEFRYTSADGVSSNRQVEPLRMVALGRRWYLVAYDLTRHDWRSFRLDRLTEPRLTGARFRPRELPSDDPVAFVRNGIGRLQSRYTVEAVVHADASTVRKRIGRWSRVTELDANRCLVQMSTDSLDWPVMALGVVCADFTIVSPSELREQIRDWGDRFGRAAARREEGMIKQTLE